MQSAEALRSFGTLRLHLLAAWVLLLSAPGLLSCPAGRAAAQAWMGQPEEYRVVLTCRMVADLSRGMHADPRWGPGCGQLVLAFWPEAYSVSSLRSG